MDQAELNQQRIDKKGFVTPIVWVALLAFVFLPFVVSKPLATEILIFSLFALAFNLMLGHTGLLSFGHAAYFGMGAYTAGISYRYFNLDVWIGLIAAIIIGILTAAGIGAVSIKKKGVYFAMISLAFAQMLYYLAFSAFTKWTGGECGLKFIPKLKLVYPFYVDLMDSRCLYYFTWVIVAVSMVILWRIFDSPFGRVLQGIRENEDLISACGYDVTLIKFVSLVFSGAFSALAGGLYTVYLGFVPVETLFWMTSGVVLLMTLLGGMHSFIGPVVGVLVFKYLQGTISRYVERWEFFVGGLFIILVLLFPEGIVGSIKTRYEERKKHRQ
jgi:branched-chain amino acid transport system permease protein